MERSRISSRVRMGSPLPRVASIRSCRRGLMASPRSADMGPMHFLRILDPALNDKDVMHPDMMAAQDLLARKQSEAARIVSEEPDVSQIRWQLDKRWYAEHGVFLPDD